MTAKTELIPKGVSEIGTVPPTADLNLVRGTSEALLNRAQLSEKAQRMKEALDDIVNQSRVTLLLDRLYERGINMDQVRGTIYESMLKHGQAGEGTTLDSLIIHSRVERLTNRLYARGMGKEEVFEAVHRLMYRYHEKRAAVAEDKGDEKR